MSLLKIYEKNNSFFQKFLFKRLLLIKEGFIVLYDQSKKYEFGDKDSPYFATVRIHNKNFYKQIIWRGSIGAAESYITGEWDCIELTNLFQIILLNNEIFSLINYNLALLNNIWQKTKNIFMRNNIKRSRKNILAHYDLGNAFFELILDQNKQYSCGIFGEANQNLASAQINKMRIICEKLKLKPSDHLLEIGTGWGGLAIFAAKNYGCKITTTTISDAQYDYVSEEIKINNLGDQIKLLKKDYRKLDGQYDKLVSVEMLESVGYHYYDQYFSLCNRLLKKKGLFLLQTITINDKEYERYKKQTDFIKAYIFPGGCLPSLKEIKKNIKNSSNFLIHNLLDIGKDYAETLACWHKNLLMNIPEILNLGFDKSFIRLFEYYFCYCRAGFLQSHISDVQILMQKL